MYTLGQAAKATGLSKSWLSKSIANGKISAQKDESGRFCIDPAELHRVFPPAAEITAGNVDGERMETPETANENSILETTLKGLSELVDQLKGERDDLRRRLDNTEAARQREAEAREQTAADLRRLTLLITHQPQEPAPQIKPPAVPMVRPVLWVALALAATAAALWWFWIK